MVSKVDVAIVISPSFEDMRGAYINGFYHAFLLRSRQKAIDLSVDFYRTGSLFRIIAVAIWWP